MAVRWSLRNGTALLVAGGVLIGSGAAVLLWPDSAVTADIGSVLSAPGSPAPIGDPPDPSAVRDDRSAGTMTSPGFVPQRLLVSSLEIDAPLTGTLTDADGALVPPDDPAQLAWWRGVHPGAGTGSVLVAGHLDVRGYDQGPLARITGLEPGNRAVLVGTDGARAVYVLRGVTTIRKTSLPAADLFGTDGHERLVLVTCGGRYDSDRRSWDSNVVAIFDPVRSG